MQTQARLVQKQHRVFVFVGRFGKEHYEKRNQPLKTFRALVELDFDAKIILHHYFQVLAVGHNSQTLGLQPLGIRFPNAAQFLGQSDAGGVQLISAPIELVSITAPAFAVVRLQLRRFSQIRKFPRAKSEHAQQAYVAVVVIFAIHDVCFEPLGEMLQMNQRPHSKIVAKPHKYRQPLVQCSQRSEPAVVQGDRRHDVIVPFLFDLVVFFDEWENFIEPPLQCGSAIAFDFVGIRPGLRHLREARARSWRRRKSVRSSRRATFDVLD